MASPASSPEASEIRRRGRRRLIGAVAIALLLIVFVPMILDSEPRPARNESALDIPAKENAPPLPAPTKILPAVAPAPAAAPAQPTVAPPKAPAPVSPPKAASADNPRLEGFAVQVGAFKDDDKLKQAREKLAAAGIRHYVERRDTPAGELRRLRAGPFPTREAAEKALAAVKAASLDGQIVPLP
jgi:DedD protein